MRESLETYVECPQNRDAIQALRDINSGFPIATNVLIQGERHSGKSSLARSLAGDIQANNAEQLAFVCSGADVALALLDETNDAFFQKIGEIPILVLDDITPLQNAEKGDQLLGLLLDERTRLGFNTAVIIDGTLDDYSMPEAASRLNDFKIVEIGPLDSEGRKEYVRTLAREYKQETSPGLAAEAIDYIANIMPGDFRNIDYAVRYLMTDEDCAERELISADDAKILLQL